MGDLLMDFSAPRQVNDNLYRMALAAFEAVAQTPSDLDWVLRYFEVWLLKLEGFFAGPSRVRRIVRRRIQWRRVDLSRAGSRSSLLEMQCRAGRGNFEERSSANESDGKTVAGKVCGRVREVPVATKKRAGSVNVSHHQSSA